MDLIRRFHKKKTSVEAPYVPTYKDEFYKYYQNNIDDIDFIINDDVTISIIENSNDLDQYHLNLSKRLEKYEDKNILLDPFRYGAHANYLMKMIMHYCQLRDMVIGDEYILNSGIKDALYYFIYTKTT